MVKAIGLGRRLFPILKIVKVFLILGVTVVSMLAVTRLPSANAIPGSGVDALTNVWAPYGPRLPSVQYNYYTSETAEFNDFLSGHLDLTDWPLAKSDYTVYDNNPDFLLTPGQGQFGMFGIDFNYASSTWGAWGCDWQHGTSPCGIEIREAFAHLIDRQSFVAQGPLGNAGQAIVDPSPPAKDPSSSSLTTQIAWDTLTGKTVSGLVVPPEISAFHVATSSGGFAAPGSPDFCVARDHLIAAGIGLRDDDMNCVIDGTSPGLANIVSHPLRFMIRSDDPFRQALGVGLMNAINQLFGTSVVQPTLGSIGQLGATVFVSAPLGATDDWDMYTLGWSLPGPFPDHLRALYGSSFASDHCGGVPNGLTQNYGFVCIPSFDTYANAASQTSNLSLFKTNTTSAFNEFGNHVGDIPVYARGIRIAALRSVAGLVNQRGASYPNTFTVLNARNDTSYTPTTALYNFGGGTNKLRWGQRQGTTQLNPFNAQTLWEFNVLNEVYDTVFTASPVQPASIICWMCDLGTQPNFDAQGNAHFFVELRQNLRWQDGVPLNASDVKFSFLNLRDVPAAAFSGNLAQLLSVTILSSNFLDIKMQGQSISHIVNLAGVPIIPRHIWELPGDRTYGDVGKANPGMTNPSYDMINGGTFIGSGPLMCESVFPSDSGRVGTGCTRNADGTRGGQSIGPGGSIFLQRFDRTGEGGNTDPLLQYMRSYNPAWGTGTGTSAESGQFQEFSYADINKDGQITVSDVASIAGCVGVGPSGSTACPTSTYNYWHRSAFDSGTISSRELSIVLSHVDDTYVSPYQWNVASLENIVPYP